MAGQLNDLITGVDDLNSSIARIIDNIKDSGMEMVKIKNYFNDSILISKLHEWIISTNTQLNTDHSENCSLVSGCMRKTEELLEENRVHGIQMKDSISRHISDIESIAGMSDSLNEMINILNTKTDHVINMLVEIHNITK